MVVLAAVGLDAVACGIGPDGQAVVTATVTSTVPGSDHACLEVALDPPADYTGDLDQAAQVAGAVIGRRLIAFGVHGGGVSLNGERGLSVDVPGMDVAEAGHLIGRSGILQFMVYNERGELGLAVGSIDGRSVPWSGAYVSRATASAGGSSLELELSAIGAELLRQVSSVALTHPVGDPRRLLVVTFDGDVLSQATVQGVISDNVRLSGLPSADAASELASSLNAGALPLPIRVVRSASGPCG